MKFRDFFQFRELANFLNLTIFKTQNSKNFKFDKLSYILSIRTIQTDVKIRNKFENKKSRNSIFEKFRKLSIWKIRKNCQLGKFQSCSIWKIRKIFNFEIPIISNLENSKNLLFVKFQKNCN